MAIERESRMADQRENKKRQRYAVLGTSALWGATAVPFITAAVVELAYSSLSLKDFGLIIAFGAPTGVLLSILGGIWLRRAIWGGVTSCLRLLLCGLVAGLALSVPASLIALMSTPKRNMDTGEILHLFLLCGFIGAISGFGYVAAFRRLLLSNRNSC